MITLKGVNLRIYALLFEAALGIEAGIWINVQQITKRNKSFSDRLAKIRKIVAVL